VNQRGPKPAAERPASAVEANAGRDLGLETARREALAWALSGLMHESRNALQLIGSCSEMLAIQLAEQPVALDLVQGIEEAQGLLVRILEDLRTYSSRIELAYRSIELADVWREAWEKAIGSGHWPRAALHETCEGVDTQCQADSAQLVRAFATLFEHALDAAGAAGMVRLTCRELDLAGARGLVVAIGQAGRNWSAEEERQLFEPFFHRRAGDPGLAMAIARRLVEEHGGQLEAANGELGGEILFTLPRARAKRS